MRSFYLGYIKIASFFCLGFCGFQTAINLNWQYLNMPPLYFERIEMASLFYGDTADNLQQLNRELPQRDRFSRIRETQPIKKHFPLTQHFLLLFLIEDKLKRIIK